VFEKAGVSTEAIFERLKENGVVAAQRLGRVRLSPHVYLLPEQIDRALSVLKTL
jgi:selenocysteine lyase/cysteine desulfurase